MSEFGLPIDVPFGPFEGTPIKVYAAKGKNARFHATETCSSLRTSEIHELTVSLERGTVQRMCQSCAQWNTWARPGTALGIFLDALTGVGLTYQLSRYLPGELEDDLEDSDVTRAAELLAKGEWPDDEEDDDLWKAHEKARDLRESLLLPVWQRAADSLHVAFDTVSRYPWLASWAQQRLTDKAEYAEELRRQLASLITPRNLIAGAAAYFLDEPVLSTDQPGLAVLGDGARIQKVLHDAWRQWRAGAVDGWIRMEDTYRVYSILDAALGRKRKGRDEAEQAIREALQEWTSAARQDTDSAFLDRLLIITIPSSRRIRDEEITFDRLLSRWQIGVIVVYTIAADWQHRLALLRVPDLVARRMLDERSDLRCVELADSAASGVRSASLLAAWVAENVQRSVGALHSYLKYRVM